MLFTTLLLISAPNVASHGAAPPAKPVEKVICRMEYEAYSRIPKRICGTQAEWDQMYKETQEDIRSSKNGRGTAPNGERW